MERILKKIVAILLLPFSLVYGIIVSIYQAAYYSGAVSQVKYSLPIFTVGNLSIGGTGKSPHVEFLIRALSPYINMAVLSRGYKRKTRGFQEVLLQHQVEDVGDEPLLIKLKYPHIPVAVSENRAFGIPKLLGIHPNIQLVVMDDAFQSMEVKPTLSLLLTEYKYPYNTDFLLPSGRLREWRHGASRADYIIVTKCPHILSESEKVKWREDLQLKPNQKLFFSHIVYGPIYNLANPQEKRVLQATDEVFLISGIARSEYIEDYLRQHVDLAQIYPFTDHHNFTKEEITTILKEFNKSPRPFKLLLTTEKDAVRLFKYVDVFREYRVQVYILPIQVHLQDEHEFVNQIKDLLLDYKI